jgi:hypothetical protein
MLRKCEWTKTQKKEEENYARLCFSVDFYVFYYLKLMKTTVHNLYTKNRLFFLNFIFNVRNVVSL